MTSKSSDENHRVLRAFDPFEDHTIEHTKFPRSSVIRVMQRVRDITDGSVRPLYIAHISTLPNGDYEIATLVDEDAVLIEVSCPVRSDQSSAAKGKSGRRP